MFPQQLEAVEAVIPVSSMELERPGSNQHSDLGPHYKLIGEALLIAEASSLTAGIPWLPPTRRVKAARMRHPNLSQDVNTAPLPSSQAPLLGCKTVSEFLRLCLVEVPTPVLVAYLDELASHGRDPELADKLSLSLTSTFERWAGALIVLAMTLLCVSLGITIGSVFLTPFALLLVICAAAVATSSESYRRINFIYLLTEEIRRRYGLLDSGMSGQTPPLSPIPG